MSDKVKAGKQIVTLKSPPIQQLLILHVYNSELVLMQLEIIQTMCVE